MRFILPLFLAIPIMASDYGLDAFAFGASRHSNREYDWKEFNPGIAAAPYTTIDDHVEGLLIAGGYRNSLNENTILLMGGIRLVDSYGDFHYGATIACGMMTGYNSPSASMFADLFIGY